MPAGSCRRSRSWRSARRSRRSPGSPTSSPASARCASRATCCCSARGPSASTRRRIPSRAPSPRAGRRSRRPRWWASPCSGSRPSGGGSRGARGSRPRPRAGARVARAWERALGVAAGWLTTAVAAAAGALAVAAALPNAAALLGAQTVLASAALPVHAEARHAADLRALGALLDYLGQRLAPGAPLFGFPAVALVPFALDRPTPTSHDYFFPGRPDHRAEAEVVRALAAARPRYLVTLNRRLGFFEDAPAYYFILRAFVHEHYALAARFGRYDVLAWRGAEPPADVPAESAPAPKERAAVLAGLAEPDRELRRAAVAAFLAVAKDVAGLGPL